MNGYYTEKTNGTNTLTEQRIVKAARDKSPAGRRRPQTIRQQRILDREVSLHHAGIRHEPEDSILCNLEREYFEIFTNTYIACSPTKKKEVAAVISSIVTLIDEREALAKDVDGTGRTLKEMDAQITEVTKKVNDLKRKVPSDLQYMNRCLQGQKAVEVLESRLDTTNKQCCMVITENRALREEIDHILIERINFNKLYYGYIQNLNHGKKLMMDIIEQATIAYDRRDEWITRLNALRNRASGDLKMHVTEMGALQKKLDNEQALEEFMAIKGQFRNMANLEENTRKQREKQREQMEICLSNYIAIMDEIKGFTQVNPQTDTEKIVQLYVDSEERNMSDFNFINELRFDMEILTDQVIAKQDQIQQQMVISEGYVNRQKQSVKEIKDYLTRTKKQAEEAKKNLSLTNSTLANIYNGIGKLFQICKCSKAPFLQLLRKTITLQSYLKITYLPDQQVINNKMIVLPTSTIEKIVPSNPCPLCVDLELVSDVIDSLQFVLTREEVIDKLSLRLELPDGLERLHNVSACHLPKSRQIIQKRYQ
ncbi:hypothetical protein RI129_013133 [Pyrocoelia pectoralis]|uniref:ODAD1 central coiled coil region domain-containing protein n=1 Tax=Pyrocoelia pectoralis TaxID=417401 RepID=A0AAN7V421_9COLE